MNEFLFAGIYTVVVMMVGIGVGASLTYRKRSNMSPIPRFNPRGMFEALRGRKPDDDEAAALDGKPKDLSKQWHP